MSTASIWVGIDVSQKQLDVYVHPLGETLNVKNEKEGIEQLIEFLTPLHPERVVLEATGRLERLALCELAATGFTVALANPQRVRSYAKALGKAKTDRLDAQVLARFGEATQLAPYPVPEALALQLMDMVGRRRQLVEIMVAEKNRLSRASSTVRQDITEHIEQLQERINALSEQLQHLMQRSDEWKRKRQLLLSLCGVGELTTAVLLAELPELGTMSHKKIARLVGIAPVNRDSGQHRGTRRIQGGRASVRSALFMATLVAIRHHSVLKAHYQQLRQRGKLKLVALMACARKLLVWLNAIVRDGQVRPLTPATAPD
jgi:transposase